jgi:hypothetical protein
MNDGQAFLEKLEDLFGNEPLGSVEEQLFQWFLFAYTGKGNGLKDLDNLNFEIFKERLLVVIDAIYQWHTG